MQGQTGRGRRKKYFNSGKKTPKNEKWGEGTHETHPAPGGGKNQRVQGVLNGKKKAVFNCKKRGREKGMPAGKKSTNGKVDETWS